MKRVAIVVAIIVAVAIAVALCGGMLYVAHHYNIKATVTEVQGNEVTFTDVVGYEWVWLVESGEQPYRVGEKVTLTMYAPTPDEMVRVLDEIVSVKR